MGGQIGSDSTSNDVVRSADEDAHDTKHNKEGDGMERFGAHGKYGEENDQAYHENTNHRGTASTEQIGGETDNDATGHHTDGVAGSDKVRGDGIKVLSEEVGEPEEENIVGKLEEAEGDGVLGNHGDTDGR